MEEDSDLESNNSLCEEPLKSREEVEGGAKSKPSITSRSRTPKRPDKPLYMPRVARERLSLKSSHEPTAHQEPPSPASCSSSCISSSSDSCSCHETTENTTSSTTSGQESLRHEADGVHSLTEDSSVHCALEEKQKLLLRLDEAEALVWDQTAACFTDMTLEDNASVPDSTQIEDSTDADDVTEEVS